MRFTKMHGIGNDYIYVNGFVEQVADPAAVSRKISDRHFGVGGDGLILILPSDHADVRMRMFNVDGSEGEMCGNGIRCVAKYAYDHGLSKSNPMRVQTPRGILVIDLHLANGKVAGATVNMGTPVLESAKIPVDLPVDRVIDYPMPNDDPRDMIPDWYDRCGLDPRMTCLNIGNPHVVLFCRDVSAVPLQTVGPWLENHRIFPKRANVHFAQVISPRELRMRTWERGSGPTLACGTGACAVCVAGAVTGRSERTILAHLPGGDLTIDWRESDNCVYKTGAAAEVFSGEWSAS